MPHEPDVDDEALAAWVPSPLSTGFEIEDARLDEADLTGAVAPAGRFARCRLAGVRLAGARLRSLRLIDVVISDADLSNADWTGAQLQRVVLERCRMTGFAGVSLAGEHVVLRSCQLALANLRGATLRDATFEDCVLDDADLGGAALREVRFPGSQLRRTVIDELRLTRVDLRGAQLEPEGDVAALRGAIIDSVQLVALGPLLARNLGLDVRYD